MDVRPCASVAAAETVLERDVDCVVTGAELGDGTGFDVLEAVRTRVPDCPVILFTDAAAHELPTDGTDHVVEFMPRSAPQATERLVSLVSETTLWQYQVAYPVPDDESARLAALRACDLEDRGAVDAFDRLTILLASHFDIEVAVVGRPPRGTVRRLRGRDLEDDGTGGHYLFAHDPRTGGAGGRRRHRRPPVRGHRPPSGA
jgi:CheY-like chemotaxis protein